MAFDGTTYRGLDDAAVNDGVDSDDLPLDVFVEQSVASNSRYLLSGKNPASVPFYGLDSSTTVSANERRWSTANQGRILHYPVVVTQGMTAIDVVLMYAVSAQDSGGDGVDCELRLVRWNTGRVRGSTFASTSFSLATNATYTSTEQTIDIPTYTGPPTVMYVELWMVSDEAGDTGSNITASSVSAFRFGASSTVSSPEQFTYRCLKSDDTDIVYDVWNADGSILEVYPDPSAVEEDGVVLSIVDLRYLELRSISIHPRYDGLVRAGCPSAEELRAQESIYSLTAIPQIAAARKSYSAPRHIAFGPPGEASPEESSASPWYKYVLEPSDSILIDGVLQDDITGDDQLEIIVTWGIANGSLIDVELNVSVEATWAVLDAGDTAWSSATTLASKNSGQFDYFFPGGARAIASRQMGFRSLEGTAFEPRLCREGIEYADEPQQFATTILSGISIQSAATSTRKNLPGRLRISFTINDGPSANIYVTSFAVIARAS